MTFEIKKLIDNSRNIIELNLAIFNLFCDKFASVCYYYYYYNGIQCLLVTSYLIKIQQVTLWPVPCLV